MTKTCCFSGHRIQKLEWLADFDHPFSCILRERIKEKILEKIDEGYTYFISGMALGVDMLCAQIILDLKKDYPNIQLECALPCADQTKYWPQSQCILHSEILSKADYIFTVNEHYHRGCNHMRNQYMVKKSNALIAIWNGSDGGTKNTIMLAARHNIPLEIINPEECLF